jgi:hypothetical protein
MIPMVIRHEFVELLTFNYCAFLMFGDILRLLHREPFLQIIFPIAVLPCKVNDLVLFFRVQLVPIDGNILFTTSF